MRLAPSILSFDLPNLVEALPRLANLGADAIHLDVMDGQFVPPITFGDAYIKSLRPLVATLFEAHLMTLTPERQFESFAEAGVNRIIFHAEATAHSHRLIQALQGMNLQAGIAINPGTPVEDVFPVLDNLDMVLVMTVNPGWGGQTFLPETLEKVRQIRKRRPDVTIEVDGGIDPKTIRAAKDAGADLFVVGSYLAKAQDLQAASNRLREAVA